VVGDGATSPPAAEQLRQYLRSRFTTRPTTTERPRYLEIGALPYGEYIDPATEVQLPNIPRFRVAVRNVEPQYTETQTDVPYGFSLPTPSTAATASSIPKTSTCGPRRSRCSAFRPHSSTTFATSPIARTSLPKP